MQVAKRQPRSELHRSSKANRNHLRGDPVMRFIARQLVQALLLAPFMIAGCGGGDVAPTNSTPPRADTGTPQSTGSTSSGGNTATTPTMGGNTVIPPTNTVIPPTSSNTISSTTGNTVSPTTGNTAIPPTGGNETVIPRTTGGDVTVIPQTTGVDGTAIPPTTSTARPVATGGNTTP